MISIRKIKHLSKENSQVAVTFEQVDESSSGQRIDNFLIRHFKHVPKNHIYYLLRSGQIRVNGRRAKAHYRLQENDCVRIPPIKSHKETNRCNKKLNKNLIIPLNYLFHDDYILAINKPAGFAVHGGSGISFGVIEQMRWQHTNWKFLELVHRLDRETSGVLLMAKKRQALVSLHEQIRSGSVKKYYWVLVKGKWSNRKQNVKLFLNKYTTAAGERRVAVVSEQCQSRKVVATHTIFTLIKSWGNCSLLEAELKTGRTHQIRVHLAHLGFPVAGDDKYGDFAYNKLLARGHDGAKLQRMFLHARKIVIFHPLSGEYLEIDAPLPEELKSFLDMKQGDSPVFKPVC